MPFRAARSRNSANASGGSYSKVLMRPAIRRSGVFFARSATMRMRSNGSSRRSRTAFPIWPSERISIASNPALSQHLDGGEHHPRGHAGRPEAQMPVADRGVDEADRRHRLPPRPGWMEPRLRAVPRYGASRLLGDEGDSLSPAAHALILSSGEAAYRRGRASVVSAVPGKFDTPYPPVRADQKQGLAVFDALSVAGECLLDDSRRFRRSPP